MGASLQPPSLSGFLAWEAAQEERYEFDGIQPVAMTGASERHALIVSDLIVALRQRPRAGCAALANELKIVSERGVTRSWSRWHGACCPPCCHAAGPGPSLAA